MKKTKNYTQEALSDEELQIHAKTIIPEGSTVPLELYSGTAKGPLTDRKDLPYQRRSDLIDPTSILDKAKNILPRNQ